MSNVTQKVRVNLSITMILEVPIFTDPNQALENMDYSFTPGDDSNVISTEIEHWELKNLEVEK